MKRVLVYPCGTEIGLEFYKAAKDATRFQLVGGSSTYDHGRFEYPEHIDHLPFICDKSNAEAVKEFNNQISSLGIDMIYPAMDAVINILSRHQDCLEPILCCSEPRTNELARSKKRTYEYLKNDVPVPIVYETINKLSDKDFPVFLKPDVGQGSVGAKKIENYTQLEEELERLEDNAVISEYLPGDEYTVDCFTNGKGKLIFSQARKRKRIKSGISVNSVSVSDLRLSNMAECINRRISFKGAWFFQVRENGKGEYVLMEIASRIAGASSYTRAMGVNLPELTLELFSGEEIDFVIPNAYSVEQDRALNNTYASDLVFEKVYMDYDDTITSKGAYLNDRAIQFIAKCKNHGIPVVLLSKHEGDLTGELERWGISGLFSEVIHIPKNDEKNRYIKGKSVIFIDDSFGERKKVYDSAGIPTFGPSMFDFLIERKGF